jgi:hypothetical protein
MTQWAQEIKAYLANELNASLDKGGFRPAADREFKDAKMPQLIAVHQLIDLEVPFGEAEAKTAQQSIAVRFAPQYKL